MATRGLKFASADHVKALNSIDIVFSRRDPKEKTIIDAWQEYLDHLNNYPKDDNDKAAQGAWNSRAENLLAVLLKSIGDRLGFEFTIVQLKRGVYYPRGHHEEILAGIALRNLVTKLSDGTWNLPLDIKSLPINQDILKLQVDVQKATLAALSGEGAMTVDVKR